MDLMIMRNGNHIKEHKRRHALKNKIYVKQKIRRNLELTFTHVQRVYSSMFGNVTRQSDSLQRDSLQCAHSRKCIFIQTRCTIKITTVKHAI